VTFPSNRYTTLNLCWMILCRLEKRSAKMSSINIAGSWAVLLVASLALAACETTPPEPPPSPVVPPSPAVAQPATPPAAPQKPSHPAPVAHPPKGPAPSPEELIGLDEAQVRELLGQPSAVNDDGLAHVLTYQARSCQLDVTFFMDMKSSDMKVLNYQWATPKKAKVCYRQLRKAHA